MKHKKKTIETPIASSKVSLVAKHMFDDDGTRRFRHAVDTVRASRAQLLPLHAKNLHHCAGGVNDCEKSFPPCCIFVLAVGVVVAAVAIAGIWWGTSSLRDEAAELHNTIATLKQYAAEEQRTLQELSGKTWRLELVDYREGGRGIILPKGLKFERAATLENGKTALIIKP